MLGLADLLFPSRCVACGRLVRGGFCTECCEAVPRLGPATCSFCGNPVPAPVPSCGECRGRAHRFDSGRQAVEFSSTVRTAIHNFKYRTEASLAGPLALFLFELVSPSSERLITWIPSQADRCRARGFDHGKALAASLATRLGNDAIPCLRRLRQTSPQISLEPEARRKNLRGAFESRPVTGAEILVVDDVFTTGATATEAARALKAAGAARVDVVCVARTIPRRRP